MRKYKQADNDGRLAMIPKWLFEGATVWLWDSLDCDDEPCGDRGKMLCPLRPDDSFSEVVIRCRRSHPVLRQIEVWSLAAYFTHAGVYFVINDFFQIRAADLEKLLHRSAAEARANKPLEAPF